MRLFLFFLSCFFSFSSFSDSAVAETAVQLPRLIVEETSAESALLDPISEDQQVKVDRTTGTSGSIESDLRKASPLLVNRGGAGAGSFDQYKGYGKSAEDIDVQALGVPLNSALGGGYNLSTLPAFLWSGITIKNGPQFGAHASHSSTGSLILTPWTLAALRKEGRRLEVSQLVSNHRYGYLSVGGRFEKEAALLGYSWGDWRGASGAFSRVWTASRVQFHLLATRNRAVTPGSLSFPTPNAFLETTRFIPILQVDRDLSRGTLKTSLYFDGQYQRTENPDLNSVTGGHTRAAGLSSVWLKNEWRLSLGAKRVSYRDESILPPTEVSGYFSVAREWDAGRWLLFPQLTLTGLRGYGVLPAGQMGARYEHRFGAGSTDVEGAFFVKVAHSPRFPSLQNRYLSAFGAIPNPGLRPEMTWTAQMGESVRLKRVRAQLSGFFQWRNEAHVTRSSGGTFQVENQGRAEIAALTPEVEWQASKYISIRQALNWATSQISSTGQAFPFYPKWSGVTDIRIRFLRGRALVQPSYRVTGASVDSAGSVVSGYGQLDVTSGIQIQNLLKNSIKSIRLSVSIQDLLDREGSDQAGVPTEGRTLALGIQATL